MSLAESHGFPRDRQPTVRLLAMPAHTNPSGNIFRGWIMGTGARSPAEGLDPFHGWRIADHAGGRGGFEQAYNAQATVTMGSLLIMGAHLTQNTNDQQEMEPALAERAKLPATLDGTGAGGTGQAPGDVGNRAGRQRR